MVSSLSGKILALEGIDGTGKSTLANSLRKEFENLGLKTFIEAEPTEFIRNIVTGVRTNGFTSFLLFSADRYMHQERILQLRSNGGIVILDRYIMSSYAYQGAYLKNEFGSFSSALEWMKLISSRLSVIPDLTIVLDANPQKCMERVESRGKSNPVFENIGLLNLVRENYLELSREFPNVEVVNSEMPASSVLKKCIEIIRNRYDL